MQAGVPGDTQGCEEKDDSIASPTWEDLSNSAVTRWREMMSGYPRRVSTTSMSGSPNYKTLFSHSPRAQKSFDSLEGYLVDVSKHADAFLNSIPGADSEPGNLCVMKLARSIKAGMLTDLPHIQQLDVLLQRRGHMMRLAEWFLSKTGIYWVRTYHPKTTFSDGLYWWPRPDEHEIKEVGWCAPYLPDIFEFNAWDFVCLLVKGGTETACRKYDSLREYIQATKLFEGACFIRQASQTATERGGHHEEFRGWKEETEAWSQVEENGETWEKPYRYIAAAFVVAGTSEQNAKTWVDDITHVYKGHLQRGLSFKIARPRYEEPHLEA